MSSPKEENQRQPSGFFSHKQIGELNGPWAFLLKLCLGVMPLLIPAMMAWCSWVTSRIFELESSARLSNQLTNQISVNSATLAAHAKAITELTEFSHRGGRFTADMAENQRLRIMQDTTGMLTGKVDEVRKDIQELQLATTRLTMMIQLQLEAQGKHGQKNGSQIEPFGQR